MIKRTVYISNPFYLNIKNEQLQLTNKDSGEINSLPIEDVGFLILDNKQIIATQTVFQKCAEQNISVVICDDSHHPTSMLFHLDTNTIQTEIFAAQANASEPLKKQLWKQTVQAKIRNQAALLKKYNIENAYLLNMAKDVKSGDIDNREGAAAKYYWKNLFPIENFKRDRFGDPPNQLLNYTYAILRAAVARSLSGSGILPTLGIHHRNKYNSFCLADDIMEPFRPFADEVVLNWILSNEYNTITKEFKIQVLNLLTRDTFFTKTKRPMMIGLTFTTASLAKCYQGKQKTINYPTLK